MKSLVFQDYWNILGLTAFDFKKETNVTYINYISWPLGGNAAVR